MVEVDRGYIWIGVDPGDDSWVRVRGRLVAVDPERRRAVIETEEGYRELVVLAVEE